MYIYIIECEDGSLYTGIAKDIMARLRQHYHHLPGCAKYTLSHQMKTLRALWLTEDKVMACKIEFWIKKKNRRQKMALIDNPETILNVLPLVNGIKAEVISVKDFEMEQVFTI